MGSSDFWTPHLGAVSLTFDDGHPSQLSKAIPLMDRAGIRGTFYLNPQGDDWRKTLQPWSDVARRGHEIGNHSLSHTCSNNFWGGRGGLEDRTLDEIETDILAAQERLVEIAPHQADWTFGYPCYNMFVGRGVDRRSYVPVVAKHFLAGRGPGEYGFANRPDVVDLPSLWSTSVTLMSAFEMIGLVEGLAGTGQWVVLVFHEIDGSRLTVGSHDFKLLLDYLVRRADAIWTAPVVEVARKIADARRDG
ncbi:MAG TPA: polysaccharide deacetylase family protein [Planctomycetota bacterium]|nr:polysaccharide deacetylase family protein [Planctomycetota bacterium]